ncbi:MAG: PQQ-binding-like beta-propeller repeat protein [Acidobacteria bacterium]|nr:PQQ-binding-like beta-propeller repeat protein [Acidobacteriota bacterium]
MRWTLFGTGLLAAAALMGQTPDDSPAARQAALGRLRAGGPGAVCSAPARMSRSYGTPCASREFAAPAILAAPRFAWTVKPGWWGVWSPFLAGDLVLAGSCNNDDQAGLSAFDMRSGQLRWRISEVCAAGNRRGSMGNVAFHELPSGELLWIYARDDGEPPDYYVVDLKAGRIVRSLKPVKRGPTRSHGAVLTVLTQSEKDQTSYLNGLTPELDRILWRNDGFRAACKDKLDRHCRPVFSPSAVSGNTLFLSATSKDQPDPPTRQLHAIDLATGRTLWRHTQQPAVEGGGYRSDDETPLVAAGRVIIRVDGLPGLGLRALDAATGRILWTTAASPARLSARVAAGEMLISEATSAGASELHGYRLSDGSLAWRRPVSAQSRLLASSGGAFYVSERVSKEEFRFQGFDGLTGTLLWTTSLPAHNLPFDDQWSVEDTRPTGLQGPSWRIGPDGAIYGVTLQGVYKLQ